MITKKDRQSLLEDFRQVFVTKDEFKAELFELKTEMLNTFATKAEMLAGFEAVMGELKAIREELAALSFRSREHSDQLENHENRLTALETSTVK